MFYEELDGSAVRSSKDRMIAHHTRGVNAAERLRSLGYRLVGYHPAQLRIERFRSDHQGTWEEFIRNSANGNLFQTRRFLAYHPAGRFEDHSLLFWRNKKLIAVAAGETANGTWSSHRFTSHAGLAVAPELSAAEALDLVHSLLSYGNAQGWQKLSMRYVPDVLAEHSFVTLAWALAVFGFSEDSREMTWCIVPRFSSEQEMLAAYHESARRAIKKALRERLAAHETDNFPEFWNLLTENLKVRFRVSPTHSLSEIESLRGLCSGELQLHGVYHQGQMIAGALIFDLSRSSSHCFYFAQNYEFQQARPMALLMHHINCEYVLRRKRRLNYGVFTAHGATELNLGLSRFKSNFAAMPAIRRRFTWEKKP